MSIKGRTVNRLPRTAFLTVADWIRKQQDTPARFKDSHEAADAVRKELGIAMSPVSFRNIAKQCGADLHKLIRHHGVGDGNSRRCGSRLPSEGVTARLDRIESMLSSLCSGLGVHVQQ